MKGLSYRDAGVDMDAGDALVERIGPMAARTRIPEVLADVGGFAGLCRVPAGLEDPVLVSGTDGVGTKLKIAFATGVHDTVGIDAVAMCVNDVLTCGARPLFFLDYFASGKLDVDLAAKVVSGVARGCEEAGCALLGGETAELPGFYPAGEYELVGFSVGVVSRRDLLDGRAVRAGDVVLGVASSGLHSNGYSLVRRALLERGRMSLEGRVPELGTTLGAALLTPTRIYARAVRAALAAGGVRALSHITGGGLPGNLPRVIPNGLVVEVDPREIPPQPIFELVARLGGVERDEMRRTFNLGVGLAVVVAPESADAVRRAVEGAGERTFALGFVRAGEPGAEAHVRYTDG